VPALAVSDSTVFVGGWFTSAGGQVRNSLAAFDATTGLLTAWDPNIPGSVFALAVRGNTVYAGGDFTSAGGQVRNNLAALDATTGLATAWDPITAEWLPRLPNSTHKVSALDANGPALVVGGAFRSIGDTPQSGVAIFPVVPPIYLPLIVR
jgi:hypothetical protein